MIKEENLVPAEDLRKDGAEAAEWCLEGAAHAGLSDHPWTSWNDTRLSRESYHRWGVVDLWLQHKDKASGPLVEDSWIVEAKESKTVEIQSQTQVERVLRYQDHRLHIGLATGINDQLAWLKRDPAMFAWLTAREEATVVLGQFVATSTRKHAFLQWLQHAAVSYWEHRRAGATTRLAQCDYFFLFLQDQDVIKGTRLSNVDMNFTWCEESRENTPKRRTWRSGKRMRKYIRLEVRRIMNEKKFL